MRNRFRLILALLLKVWDIIYGSFPGYETGANELDAAFEEKYPNVTVEHIGQPFETYNQL